MGSFQRIQPRDRGGRLVLPQIAGYLFRPAPLQRTIKSLFPGSPPAKVAYHAVDPRGAGPGHGIVVGEPGEGAGDGFKFRAGAPYPKRRPPHHAPVGPAAPQAAMDQGRRPAGIRTLHHEGEDAARGGAVPGRITLEIANHAGEDVLRAKPPAGCQRLGHGKRLECVIGEFPCFTRISPTREQFTDAAPGRGQPFEGRTHRVPDCQPNQGPSGP